MGLYDNLVLSQSQYVPQYVGLPLEEYEKAGNVLQDRYYKNLAEANRIDLLDRQRMAIAGDEALNKQISEPYRKTLEELAKSGNYENLTGKVSALTTDYLGDKTRIAVEENFKRFQEEQALAQKMRAQGLTPIGLGDPTQFSSLDPETGQTRLYNSRISKQLDYRQEQEKLFDDVRADMYSLGLSKAAAKYFGGDQQLAEVFLRTGKVGGISSKKIQGLLEGAFDRYKSSAEYKQQKEYAEEVLGVPTEQADDVIREQVLQAGMERVYNIVDDNYIQNPIAMAGLKGGAGDPNGLLYPRLVQGVTSARKQVNQNLVTNAPTSTKRGVEISPSEYSTLTDLEKENYEVIPGGELGPIIRRKTDEYITGFDKLRTDLELRETYKPLYNIYFDMYEENQNSSTDEEGLSDWFNRMDPDQRRVLENKAVKRYEGLLAASSAAEQTGATQNPKILEAWKNFYGVSDKQDLEKPGLGNLEIAKWIPVDGSSSDPMTAKQVMESLSESGFLRGTLDYNDEDDQVEFKQKLLFGKNMILPTEFGSSGIPVQIGNRRYVLETPILDEKLGQASDNMRLLNSFLGTVGEDQKQIPFGTNHVLIANKKSKGYNSADDFLGYDYDFLLYDLNGRFIGETDLDDIKNQYVQQFMLSNPFGLTAKDLGEKGEFID